MKKFINTALGKLIVKLLQTEIGKLIVQEILNQFKNYLCNKISDRNSGLTEYMKFHSSAFISQCSTEDFLNDKLV